MHQNQTATLQPASSTSSAFEILQRRFASLKSEIAHFISDYKRLHGNEVMREEEMRALNGLDIIKTLIEEILDPAKQRAADITDTRYDQLVGQITGLLPPATASSGGFFGFGSSAITLSLHAPMKQFVSTLMQKEAESHSRLLTNRLEGFEKRLEASERETKELRTELENTRNQLVSVTDQAKMIVFDLGTTDPEKAAMYAKKLGIEYKAPMLTNSPAAAASSSSQPTTSGAHSLFSVKEALPSKYQPKTNIPTDKSARSDDDKREYDKSKLKKFLSDAMYASVYECVEFYNSHKEDNLKSIAKIAIDNLLANYDKPWATNMNLLLPLLPAKKELPAEIESLIKILQDFGKYADELPIKARDLAYPMLSTLYFDGYYIPKDTNKGKQYSQAPVVSSSNRK
jgi:hypothetical protein